MADHTKTGHVTRKAGIWTGCSCKRTRYRIDILDLGISGVLYHVVQASLSRLKIGSNATDALIEGIRVEVLKFQKPSFKTCAEINCRMKV